MLVSTIFLWLAIAAGFVIALPSIWLCGLALWPDGAQKRTHLAAHSKKKSLLLGLTPLVLSVTILTKLNKGGGGAVVVVGILLLWGFASAEGLATFIGRKVWPDLEHSAPWKQTFRGGLLLTGAALLPVVGWFFILPLIAVLGWGLSMGSWFLNTPPRLSEIRAETPSSL